MSENEEPDSDGSLGEDVYNRLLADILAARLSGGTPIQQRRLALQYAVSRSPMRHALSRLEGEGLLIRDETGDLQVRTVNLPEYLHSLDMRVLLEPPAAALASANPDPTRLAHITATFDALVRGASPDPEKAWQFDDLLHGYIASRTGNPFMVAYIRDLRRYTTIFERQLPVVRTKPGMREHAALLEGLSSGRPEAARAAMSFHLEVVRTGVLENY